MGKNLLFLILCGSIVSFWPGPWEEVSETGTRGQRTLLGQEETETALQRNTLARPLVVGREARRVRRLGHLSVGNLFERVQAVALVVEGVHEMHGGSCVVFEMISISRNTNWVSLCGNCASLCTEFSGS